VLASSRDGGLRSRVHGPQTGHTLGRLPGSSGHARAPDARYQGVTDALMRRTVVPPIFQAGGSSSSLHDDLGRVHRVKVKQLRGRFASPDTAAMAKRVAATGRTGRSRSATIGQPNVGYMWDSRRMGMFTQVDSNAPVTAVMI
jgi:hypothetical protein